MIVLRDLEARKKIRLELGITSAALSYALSFKRNSLLAARARAMALENGGKLLEEVATKRTVKVLDAKGNLVKVLNTNDFQV